MNKIGRYSRERVELSFIKRQMTDEQLFLFLKRQAVEATGEAKIEKEQRFDSFVKTLEQRVGKRKVKELLKPSYEVSDFWLSEELCRKLQLRWGSYHDFEKSESKKPIIKALKQVVSEFEDPTVLEIGCGCGHFLWAIRPYTKRVVGIDSSPYMLQITKEMFAEQGIHNVGLRHGTCWRLPFASGSIDVVFQVDVCMHVGGSWQSIKEMLRVAKKAILFTGPSFEPEQVELDKRKSLFGLSWGVSQPLLETRMAQAAKRKPKGILSYYYLKRPSTKIYKHKILVIEKEYKGRKMKPSKRSLMCEFTPESIGVLCRGKSLEKLASITKGFSHCFIVNSWKKEWKAFREELKDKKVVHFINHEESSVMTPGIYQRMSIVWAINYWTNLHKQPGYTLKDTSVVADLCKKAGIELVMMPDRFLPECDRIRNSGVMCCLYVAEVFKPKTMWIAGLDFYAARYWVGGLTEYQERQREKGLTDRLVNEFVDIVERYPETTFKILTYYDDLPKLDNLKVLREKKKR